VTSAGFLPVVDGSQCTGCGNCLWDCSVQSLALVDAGDERRPTAQRADVDPETCLGCGLCMLSCRQGAVTLGRRPERTLTPVNTAHRVVRQAVEHGTLAELVFHQSRLAALGGTEALSARGGGRRCIEGPDDALSAGLGAQHSAERREVREARSAPAGWSSTSAASPAP